MNRGRFTLTRFRKSKSFHLKRVNIGKNKSRQGHRKEKKKDGERDEAGKREKLIKIQRKRLGQREEEKEKEIKEEKEVEKRDKERK